jgi:hypothetical protein
MMLGQFLIAIFTGLIFIHGYNGGGMVEGVRFGILMAGFSIAPCSSIMPWSYSRQHPLGMGRLRSSAVCGSGHSFLSRLSTVNIFPQKSC